MNSELVERKLKEWEEKDKKGYMLPKEESNSKSFCMMDNLIIRQIIHCSDMQTAMVYLIILSHRNAENNKCFPSISLISRECGVSTSTVKRKIKELEEYGFISINSGKQNVSNNYYFPLEDFYDSFNKEDIDQKLARRLKRAFKPKSKNIDNNEIKHNDHVNDMDLF